MTRYENITQFPLNPEQLLYKSYFLTQITTKMTEKYAENNLR
jgi:hypothetical protein